MPRPGQQPRLNKRRKGPRSTVQDRMRRVKERGGVPEGIIKVQLDARTVITLASEKALTFWRIRYPHLRIIPS